MPTPNDPITLNQAALVYEKNNPNNNTKKALFTRKYSKFISKKCFLRCELASQKKQSDPEDLLILKPKKNLSWEKHP